MQRYLRLFRFWEGYRSTRTAETNLKKPDFQVRQNFNILRRNSDCEVILGLDTNQPYNYVMTSLNSKCACKIVDNVGDIVAQLKRKEAGSGIVFGKDVLTMEVKPCVDHSLIMGLLVVYSLINSIM